MFEGTIVTHRTFCEHQTRECRARIKSYWDLLQPKWKGKLLGQDPRGAALADAGVDSLSSGRPRPDFVRRLYTETEITLFRDRRQGTNWLATWKVPLCHFVPRDRQSGAARTARSDDIAS